MGEYSEFFINNEIWADMWSEFDRPSYFKWIDKDGNEHKLSEMTTSHIQNCIKLLENKKMDAEIKIEMLTDELERRND